MHKKQTIIITGGNGFLGSYIAAPAVKLGYFVKVIDVTPPLENNENIESIVGSILDKGVLNRSISKGDIVFHLAGISDIDECLLDPVKCVTYNVLGTTKLLQVCVEKRIAKFIFASSMYAGGNHGGFYSSTKKTCEMIIKDFHNFFNLKYSLLRFGTIYGLGAPETNSIEKFLTEALDSNQINYTGDGTEIREYIHVEDAADLSLAAIRSSQDNKTLAITGSYKTRTSDLFNIIRELMGGDLKINFKTNITEGRTESHYKVCPYTYTKDRVFKLTKNTNRELNDALLEILEDK